MALDAYSPCPCGSGKKFKWCCQPVHVDIDKAFRLDGEGQHEAALRLMDQVTAAFPENPEAWGRKAQLLYQNSHFEDAESALQKAFDLNPNYPFGNFLRGIFRQSEGEIPGALLLFRKAADLYDPEARDILGQLYSMIADCELKMNRPVAARAALKITQYCLPGNEEIRKSFDEIFGDKSVLPATARKDYAFLSPPASASAARREAWNRALAADRPVAGAKLSNAARIFGQLTTEDAQDAAAWFNLGLVQAWLGDNRNALSSLDRYVELEADEQKAADAWALAEVLRCGYGMHEEANYFEHSAIFQIRDPEPVFRMVQDWAKDRRLIIMQNSQEERLLAAMVMERVPQLTGGLGASRLPGLGAFLLLVADTFRVWGTNADAVGKVLEEVNQRVGPALNQVQRDQRPANFNEVLAEALAFPVNIADEAEARRRVNEHFERFFEETWIHRPLKSLNLIPPIDAAGHANLRKKLRGAVRFLEDCASGKQEALYDFDRLRRKLGLMEATPIQPAGADPGALDVSALGAPELAALPLDNLSDDLLEQAYQTALKVDARDLAGRFAKRLVGRPARKDRPDRFPWYSHLVQLALAEGNTDAALDYINEGEKDDCEQNEGRRRNDYELRRGQVLARRGEADQAQGVFERLIERVPAEMRFRSAAAEAMLSAKQGTRALRFAEDGLSRARQQNDRDSEEHFMELVSASRKQG